MADTGKQSPLGVNVLGSLLAGHNIATPESNTFFINPVAESLYGKSKNNAQYEPGKIVNDTCLKWVTYALKEAWARTPMNNIASEITPETYDKILNIGQSRIPALGNSKPPTYQVDDPTGFWQKTGAANTGLAITGNVDHGQDASWDPWDSGDPAGSNPNSEVTKWGWVRAMALQAYNEFYFNAEIEYTDPTDYSYNSAVINDNPSYKDFTDSYLRSDSFIKYSNEAIIAVQNSQTFLQGTFSNQDDLITGDISGISLSARAFGQDLINLGKAVNLSLINIFGLPSGLLRNLQQNNALTSPLVLALMVSGLTTNEIQSIASGNITPTIDQEQKIYAAYLVITNTDLAEILTILKCKTKKLENLADLLNIKKIFPLSYRTLTVPIYNTNPGPTNSKTYYLLFINDGLNPQLVLPRIKETIGEIVPQRPPPVVIEPQPAPPPEPQSPPIIIPEPPKIPAPDPIPPPAPVIEPPMVPVLFPIIGGGGGGCVALESFVPLVETEQKHNSRDITNAWMLESGMKISLGNDNLEIVDGQVVKTLNDYQPCVRIETADGISLVCSTTAPIFTKDDGFVLAPELFGKRVAVMRNGRTWYDEVVRLEDIGMKFVRVIDTGNNSFWAGEKPGSFILHHNAIINDQNDVEKN